jgi:hypothetical protein
MDTNVYTFDLILFLILLQMINVLDKGFRENQTPFYIQ